MDAVILVGLFGAALTYIVTQVLQGHIIPPVMAFSIVLLICGVIAATRWRWSMVIPLILTVLIVAFQLAPNGFPFYALTHPSEYDSFAPILIHLAFAVAAIFGCAAKLGQTLRHEASQTPRWLTSSVTALVGFTVGMLLLGAVAQPTVAGASGGSQAKGTEAVHLTGSAFAPDIVALHKGDSLMLIADAPVPHIITNGSWGAGNKPLSSAEPGAPTLNNLSVNGNSATIGPFTTPGTYHIYCTVHPGMNLTIIVQ
jgi:plastocyanin